MMEAVDVHTSELTSEGIRVPTSTWALFQGLETLQKGFRQLIKADQIRQKEAERKIPRPVPETSIKRKEPEFRVPIPEDLEFPYEEEVVPNTPPMVVRAPALRPVSPKRKRTREELSDDPIIISDGEDDWIQPVKRAKVNTSLKAAQLYNSRPLHKRVTSLRRNKK